MITCLIKTYRKYIGHIYKETIYIYIGNDSGHYKFATTKLAAAGAFFSVKNQVSGQIYSLMSGNAYQPIKTHIIIPIIKHVDLCTGGYGHLSVRQTH